ncbi:hypothetical protein FSARC_9920 [Fusarium sarcochroum]|uniref:Uncharacterized protein n=1 Tax=Fusarium sarcochroum TaxID=1208366 RepID=A0A8H4TQ01_9HYPO|nr:hypothetical protein FSARC_9920 [Fusarium sarcochroum]
MPATRASKQQRNPLGTNGGGIGKNKQKTDNTEPDKLDKAVEKLLKHGGSIHYQPDQPTNESASKVEEPDQPAGESMDGVVKYGSTTGATPDGSDSGVSGVGSEEASKKPSVTGRVLTPVKATDTPGRSTPSDGTQPDDPEDIYHFKRLDCSLATKMARLNIHREGTTEGYVKSYGGKWYRIVRVGETGHHDFDIYSCRGDIPDGAVNLDNESIASVLSHGKSQAHLGKIVGLQGVACYSGVKGVVPKESNTAKSGWTLPKVALRLRVKWSYKDEKGDQLVTWEKYSLVKKYWKNLGSDWTSHKGEELINKCIVNEDIVVDEETLVEKGQKFPNFEGTVLFTAWERFKNYKEFQPEAKREISPNPSLKSRSSPNAVFLQNEEDEEEI